MFVWVLVLVYFDGLRWFVGWLLFVICVLYVDFVTLIIYGLFISVFIVLSLKCVVCCLVVYLLVRIADSVGGLSLPCGFCF